MRKLLATFEYHDDAEKGPQRAFVEDLFQAVCFAVVDDLDLDPPEEGVRKALAELEGKPEKEGVFIRGCCDAGYPLDEDDEGETVCLWNVTEGGIRKVGVVHGERPGGLHATWIALSAWTPDPKRKAELEAMSKEDLVQRLLEIEATA
jgi:hypothetical protein